ncbi:MAG: hypothetical protein MUO31_07755 [Thermodesulfovibrionales bacterium]|nr:hypothetical protein [Thermodesulfovibrionales bacterium]
MKINSEGKREFVVTMRKIPTKRPANPDQLTSSSPRKRKLVHIMQDFHIGSTHREDLLPTSPYTESSSEMYAKQGSVGLLKQSLLKYGKLSFKAPAIAAKYGNIDCLKYLLDIGAADFSKPSIWSLVGGEITNNLIWDAGFDECWESLQFLSPGISDNVKQVVKSRFVIHEAARYEAAKAAVAAGHNGCIDVCGIYNVEIALSAAKSGKMPLFRHLLRRFNDYPKVEGGKSVIENAVVMNVEWLRAWLTCGNVVSENAKSLACTNNSTECVQFMVDHYMEFKYPQHMAATVANSTACIEVIVANTDRLSISKSDIYKFRLEYAMAAAERGYTKSLLAWNMPASNGDGGIYANCVTLSALKRSPPDYAMFKLLINKYNPYNCTVDDDMPEIGHRLEHDPKLLRIWCTRMRQFRRYRIAHNACIEDDVDTLINLVGECKFKVQLWLFEECVTHGSVDCLKMLCQFKSVFTHDDWSKLADTAKKYGYSDCVDVLLNK